MPSRASASGVAVARCRCCAGNDAIRLKNCHDDHAARCGRRCQRPRSRTRCPWLVGPQRSVKRWSMIADGLATSFAPPPSKRLQPEDVRPRRGRRRALRVSVRGCSRPRHTCRPTSTHLLEQRLRLTPISTTNRPRSPARCGSPSTSRRPPTAARRAHRTVPDPSQRTTSALRSCASATGSTTPARSFRPWGDAGSNPLAEALPRHQNAHRGVCRAAFSNSTTYRWFTTPRASRYPSKTTSCTRPNTSCFCAAPRAADPKLPWACRAYRRAPPAQSPSFTQPLKRSTSRPCPPSHKRIAHPTIA